jgi:hypothetical protein
VVTSRTAVAQRVDDHTLLVSVLEDDAARAARQLGELCGRARGSRGLTEEMRQLSQKTGLWLLPGFPDTGAARPLRGIVGAGQRENGAL